MNIATLVHIAVYPHRSSHRATFGPIRSRRATASAPRVAKTAPVTAKVMTFGRWVTCPSHSRITRRTRPGLLTTRDYGHREGTAGRALPVAAVPASSRRAPMRMAGPAHARGRRRGHRDRYPHRPRRVSQRRTVRRPRGSRIARPRRRAPRSPPLRLRTPAPGPLAAGSELVVEWRALTVALLDRLAPLVWECLGPKADPPPLVKRLEGGTWSAGRRIAAERAPAAHRRSR